MKKQIKVWIDLGDDYLAELDTLVDGLRNIKDFEFIINDQLYINH